MLGGTQLCTSAVRSGTIDLYLDYTGALSVKPEPAKQYDLNPRSALAKVSDQFPISPTLAFAKRKGSLSGLQKKYNMTFQKVVVMNSSPRDPALSHGERDVQEAHPELEALLGQLCEMLTDDVMRTLNYPGRQGESGSGNGREALLAGKRTHLRKKQPPIFPRLCPFQSQAPQGH